VGLNDRELLVEGCSRRTEGVGQGDGSRSTGCRDDDQSRASGCIDESAVDRSMVDRRPGGSLRRIAPDPEGELLSHGGRKGRDADDAERDPMRTGVVQRADVGQHERGLDEENDAESGGNQPCTGERSPALLTRVRIHSAELPVLDIDRRRPDGVKLTSSRSKRIRW